METGAIKTNQEWASRLTALLLGLTVLALLAISLLRVFDHDEFEHIHTAWKLGQGEVPYRDFFQHHHLLLHTLMRPWLGIFGDDIATILLMRVLFFGILLVTAVTVYRLARLHLERIPAQLAVLFFLTLSTVYTKGIEIRPDLAAILAVLWSLLFLLRQRGNETLRPLLLSGMAFGIGFMLLQKAIVFLPVIGVFILQRAGSLTQAVRDGSLFFLASAAVTSLYFVVIPLSGWEDYLFYNWTYNLDYASAFPPWATLKAALLENPGVIALFLLSFLVDRRAESRRMALTGLFLLSTVLLVKKPYPQYLLPAMPFLAIAAAGTLQRLFNREPRHIMVLATIPLLLVPLLGMYGQVFRNNQFQLSRINYVLTHTSPGEHVHDGDAQINLFRPDIDFMWFSLKRRSGGLATMQQLRHYQQNLGERIEEHQPRIITLVGLKKSERPAILEHYREVPEFRGLFIRK
jgi:hypothetical protein